MPQLSIAVRFATESGEPDENPFLKVSGIGFQPPRIGEHMELGTLRDDGVEVRVRYDVLDVTWTLPSIRADERAEPDITALVTIGNGEMLTES